MVVVAVRWKVLAVPELAWKRTGSRSVLFPPFTWICRHNHLGHHSLNDVWESDEDSDKPLWLPTQAGPHQSDRMRLGNCHRCRQGRGCGSQSEVILVTQLCCIRVVYSVQQHWDSTVKVQGTLFSGQTEQGRTGSGVTVVYKQAA